MARKKTPLERLQDVEKLALEYGMEDDVLFKTTLNRYKTQVNMMAELEKELSENDMTVKKEYVKGRENIYVHPAFRAYTSLTASANQTVQVLVNMLAKLRAGDARKDGAAGFEIMECIRNG